MIIIVLVLEKSCGLNFSSQIRRQFGSSVIMNFYFFSRINSLANGFWPSFFFSFSARLESLVSFVFCFD